MTPKHIDQLLDVLLPKIQCNDDPEESRDCERLAKRAMNIRRAKLREILEDIAKGD